MRYTLLLCAAFTTLAAGAEHSLPIFFISNSGQADPALRYVAQTREMVAGFADDSAVFQIHGAQVHVHFTGANPRVAVQGMDAMAAHANFLIGDDPAEWHTDVPTYRGIVYRNLYAGIDMMYPGNETEIKSEFLVAPGADPQEIRLEYPDADRLFVDADGDLVVRAGPAE